MASAILAKRRTDLQPWQERVFREASLVNVSRQANGFRRNTRYERRDTGHSGGAVRLRRSRATRMAMTRARSHRVGLP